MAQPPAAEATTGLSSNFVLKKFENEPGLCGSPKRCGALTPSLDHDGNFSIHPAILSCRQAHPAGPTGPRPSGLRHPLAAPSVSEALWGRGPPLRPASSHPRPPPSLGRTATRKPGAWRTAAAGGSRRWSRCQAGRDAAGLSVGRRRHYQGHPRLCLGPHACSGGGRQRVQGSKGRHLEGGGRHGRAGGAAAKALLLPGRTALERA